MRIVAGQYGGRSLESPKGSDIRPTSDKIRGAIFNALLSRIDVDGTHVLDLFCGSGALGLEALSRGAAHCLFTDKAKTSLELAKLNARQFNVPQDMCDFRISNATQMSENWQEHKADLAFLDPPYSKDLIIPCLQRLHDGGWLNSGAVCVVESEAQLDLRQLDIQSFDLAHDGEKRYGTTKITYLIYNGQ